MSRAEHSEIWREKHRLNAERREFMKVSMAEFDKQHFEKVRALQERCGKLGHVHGNFHDNGLGWTWYYCNQCGAAFDKVNHS